MLIKLYPLNAVIYPTSNRDLKVIRDFSYKFIKWSEHWDKRTKRMVRSPEYSYVFFTDNKKEVRMLRTMFREFLYFLYNNNYVENEDFKIKEDDVNNVVDDIYPEMNNNMSPRGEQQDVIDFISGFDKGMPLLHLTGGVGKSYCSMKVINNHKERFIAIMRPTLIGTKEDEGWIHDFYKGYDIKKEEICRVQGSTQLKSIINHCVTLGYNPYKAVLISNKTIMNFIKNYEKYSHNDFKLLGYNCTPSELPKILGVNSMVIDEAHFDHHLNCKIASYFCLKRLIGATATPNFDDYFTDRMVKMLFPVEMRYKQKNNTIHIQPISYHYKLKNPNSVDPEGYRGYNHINFEKSIYKNIDSERNYNNMVYSIIEEYHDPKLTINPEFKCLITVGSIDVAKKLSQFLSYKYPDKKVTSYVDKDPVSNLYDSDICVSTVKGAGTGHDIANLATVIMTNAINSSTANLQCAWRLRKMKYEVEHSFIYLVCDDIDTHIKYDNKKKNKTFREKTLPVINCYSSFLI